MPELTAIHVGLLLLMLIIGMVFGWIVRGDRCAKEKIAVSAGWQDQLESQQSEHNRLAEQNRSLMEQIAQYQAAQKDYSNRARELSDSLKEAFARRDELQRQLRDARGNLEVAIAQRNRLQSQNPKGPAALKEKDDKIFRLSRELTSWQSRVPPLVERYQERDQQARQYEEELRRVQARLQALEDLAKSDQTRIEPVDADSLPDGGDASNEPDASTAEFQAADLQDQIDTQTDQQIEDQVNEQVDEQVEDQVDEQADAHLDDQIDDQPDDQLEDQLGARNKQRSDDLAELAGDDFVPVTEFDEPAGEAVLADEAFAAVFVGDQDSDDDVNSGDEANDDANGADDKLQVPPPAAADAAHPQNDVDNLQLIKGIGPSIEKTLQDLGFNRFHQIAEMSEYDIDRVAQQLKGFRSRIYREDWIGQARELQYQKSRDPS